MFKKIAAVSAALTVAAGSAMAALPAGVETSATSAGTDGTTLLGILAGVGASVFIIARLLRKFGLMP